MQSLLEELMQDLVGFLLDVNIYVRMSDTAKKYLFDYVVGAIKYYWPVKPLTSTKSIFLWLARLSLLDKYLQILTTSKVIIVVRMVI